MSAYLLVSSGDGPEECQMAVSHVLARMVQEAVTMDIDFSLKETHGRVGPVSAIVSLGGDGITAFARSWVGTVKWICQSPLRPHHKRQNWFIGVHVLDRPERSGPFDERDVGFSTLRAGGPGGQHQNTTESAVRAAHRPSGIVVVVRSERSQHRNKVEALNRLQDLLALTDQAKAAKTRREENLLHHSLERGNPVRIFKGKQFQEVR